MSTTPHRPGPAQLPLFGPVLPAREREPAAAAVAVPFQVHSATSREAAAKQRRSGRAASLEAWVLDFFRVLGPLGATDEELDTAGRHAGLVFDTLRPRRIAWWHKGLVCEATTPDGWLLRRRNSNGNRMQVWVWNGKELER